MTTITLTVTSFNGQPGDGSLSAQFDELGGLIGRADTNQFVLPDPDRSISRVHAQVVFRNNRYAIIDRGSNPILVNGQAAGNDREMPLRDGDLVQIGGYELQAKLVDGAAAKAASSDPFADLLGAPPAKASTGAGAALLDPLAAFGAPAQPPRAPAPSPFAPPPAAPSAAGGIPDDWNPFAPDAGSAPARPGSGFGAPAGGGRGGGGGGGLGLDLGAAAPAALIPELSGGGGGDSLDSLFGLKASSGADPFAQSALGQAAAQPNMAAHADPLKSLSSAAKATSETVTDNVSDLNRPFMSAPLLSPAAPPRPAVPPPAPERAGHPGNPAGNASPAGMPRPGTTAPGMAGGAVLSWDSEPSGSHTVIRPGGLRDDPAAIITRGPLSPAPQIPPMPIGTDIDPFAALAPAGAPQAPLDAAALFGAPAPAQVPAPTVPPMAAPMPTQPPAAPRPSASATVSTPASAPARPAAMPSMTSIMAPATAPAQRAATPVASVTQAVGGESSADVQALFEAFKEGLGDPDLKFNTLTPELMRLVGGLLYEASSGTVDMLVARAALKRELRAESTMIKARENNPLKFSPTAEVALQHLLSPPARGFMAAAPAMKDAYTDLRAHQFGMVAGMRAALEGVLDRFNPAELEGRLTQRSVLHSLMPGSRKARLWEVFVEHFSQIREEASEDFQNLFGAAFLQAYNDHIDQIDREGK